MTEPRHADPFLRALLDSARADAPSAASRAKITAGAIHGAALGAAPGAALGLKGVLLAAGSAAMCTALVTLAVVGRPASEAPREVPARHAPAAGSPARHAPAAGSPEHAPSAPPSSESESPPIAPTPPVSAARRARSPASARALAPPPPPPRASTLENERALLAAARVHALAGRHDDALADLTRYDARHPRGLLSEEAAVLKLDTLARAGRADEASRAARGFLRDHPSTPYATRARAVLRATTVGEETP